MRNMIVVGGVLTGALLRLPAAEIPLAKFSPDAPQWHAEHHVARAAVTAEGLSFDVVGDDPWLEGPTLVFPEIPASARRVRLTMTCAPTAAPDSWQLFHTFRRPVFNEADSVRLHPEGRPPYTRFRAELPVESVLAGPCRFRLDPPGGTSHFTVKSLSVEFKTPLWRFRPTPPVLPDIPDATPFALAGAGWKLLHAPGRIGAFRYLSRGKTVESNPAESFVYLDRKGTVRTLDWSAAKVEMQPPTPARRVLATRAEISDVEGRRWRLCREFRAGNGDRDLVISTRVQVRDATGEKTVPAPLLHLPYLTLFVDRASGGRKRQALLAGVEYLDDEPSSNEKEIRTAEHDRRIPDAYRLSAPLAILTDAKNWLAFNWRADAAGGLDLAPEQSGPWPFSPVFDSPDRLFGSGGHLLAFWAPAVGRARRESQLDIYAAEPFTQGVHAVVLRTGAGASVADALQAVVPARPAALPAPDAIDLVDALKLLARGWLDSGIRQGVRVRHAVGEPFGWSRSGDAPVLMQYLAAALARRAPAESNLVSRLRETAADMLRGLSPQTISGTGVSHIRFPAPVLVAGDVRQWLDDQDRALRRMNVALASGKRLWQAPAGQADLGETLGADHCNGFTSMLLLPLLQAASWSGDEAEIAKALAIVDKVTERYHGTVPRGAQPWEMPLHTPDIMASANLTRAYALAYQLKPESRYLDEARHWAYTGLSMVYLLSPPFAFDAGVKPVGRYATCAVMGATQWIAPNWIGRPVQWCGLVYASGLWNLARLEPDQTADGAAAFWTRLATGITASGVRQTHPEEDAQWVGLLPDSWNLATQSRYAVPINPGTVQENVAELTGLPYYSRLAFADGSCLHVPGALSRLQLENGRRICEIEGWPESPFQIVLARTSRPAEVLFNGRPIPFDHVAAHRALVVTLPPRAKGRIEIRTARENASPGEASCAGRMRASRRQN
ncbi:MAG: hypothetical protein ACI4Q3_06415 [Kiritimatiellia bacterium]